MCAVRGAAFSRATLGLPFCFVSQMVSVGPIWAHLGPDCVPRSETKKVAVSPARRTGTRFRGPFVPVQTPTPLLVVSTP